MKVHWDVVKSFLAAAGAPAVITVALFHTIYIGTLVACNMWLSHWSIDPVQNGTQANTQFNLSVYAGIVITHSKFMTFDILLKFS